MHTSSLRYLSAQELLVCLTLQHLPVTFQEDCARDVRNESSYIAVIQLHCIRIICFESQVRMFCLALALSRLLQEYLEYIFQNCYCSTDKHFAVIHINSHSTLAQAHACHDSSSKTCTYSLPCRCTVLSYAHNMLGSAFQSAT